MTNGLFAFPPDLDTDRFRAAWAEWRQHRVELHRPMTPTSERRLLLKLADWGESRAVAAVIYSIEQNWRGIYEAKEDSAEPGQVSTCDPGYPTFGEAWAIIRDALKPDKPPNYNGMPPVVREALRQFGAGRYIDTKTQQMPAAFAQFRQIYEAVLAKARNAPAPELKVFRQSS